MEIVRNGNEATVYLKGTLDITTSREFKESMLGLIKEGVRKVYLDVGELKSLDSSGIGKILLVYSRLKENNGSMEIVNLKEGYVKKLFDLIKIGKIIPIKE